MNPDQAAGLVLRTRLLTETSLIVHWITRESGRIATVAKGARRPKSPFRGKLDLFYLADITFQRSRRSDLHLLREVALRETYPALRHDLGRLRQAAYAAVLVERNTEAETPVETHFSLLLDLVRCLADNPPRPSLVLAFELKLLDVSGMKPDLAGLPLPADSRELAVNLLARPFGWIAQHNPARHTIQTLNAYLRSFQTQQRQQLPRIRSAALSC
jgi:DNA repair protein RecO (recombination protein O)